MSKNHQSDHKEPIDYLLTSLEKHGKVIVAAYQIRWRIESAWKGCFKHMKSTGFQLEKINLSCEKKTRLLITLTVLAYTLSVVEGLKEYGKVAVKKYANGTNYKEVSAFRLGLDTLVIKYNNFKKFCRYFIS